MNRSPHIVASLGRSVALAAMTHQLVTADRQAAQAKPAIAASPQQGRLH